MSKNYKSRLKEITTLIFDVDGVFTDSSLFLLEGTQPMRKMNVKDGYVLQLAVKCGYRVAIISGGRSEAVRERFAALGVEDIYLGSHRKITSYEELKKKYAFKDEHVLYMGDDIPDIPVLQHVGLACCPEDAAVDVKAVCQYISHRKGGDGCIRDILEQLLRLHGHWMSDKAKEW